MAFTELYCTSLGSNLNAGGLSNGAEPGPNAVFTSTNGNWSTSLNNFRVTDGTNPSSSITIGDFASIYNDGASTAVYIARINAVDNKTNGNITVDSSSVYGTAPTTSATGRSIKVGGAWKGPNGASVFPIGLSGSLTALKNSASSQTRVNFKNDQTYSMTTTITTAGVTSDMTMQGYSAFAGDGGKATIDFGTTTGNLLTESSSRSTWTDMIFASSATSGTGSLFTFSNNATARAIRCVAHGARNAGFLDNSSLNATFIECEAYDNNKSNTADSGGFVTIDAQTPKFLRCYSHDNSGSNSAGFVSRSTAQGIVFSNCISDSNGGIGFNTESTTGIAAFYLSCDAYNNTSDGIKIGASATSGQLHWIENCNLIKNGGKGINNASGSSQWVQGYVYSCGYGSGTQVNVGGDATLLGLIEAGKVTYANNITPWNAPTTGDFTTVLAAALSVGRGAFTQTDGTNTGTIGYPDIGAAQAQPITQSWVVTGTQTLPDGFLQHLYGWKWFFAQDATITVLSGALPTGLSLSQPTSQSVYISGTPTVVGIYDFVLRATIGTSTGDSPFRIEIKADPNEGIGALMGGLRPTC